MGFDAVTFSAGEGRRVALNGVGVELREVGQGARLEVGAEKGHVEFADLFFAARAEPGVAHEADGTAGAGALARGGARGSEEDALGFAFFGALAFERVFAGDVLV